MIINLWSTPRTGSVRYSFEMRRQHLNSILITELFNRYHMKQYHNDVSGGFLNLNEYVDGCYYRDHSVIDGEFTTKKVYQPRTRSIEQEEEHRASLLQQIDSTKTVILHNHVEPMNLKIRESLIDSAHQNVYIYRKNKRLQLASYAIAYSTKQFASWKKSDVQKNDVVADIDVAVLENLVRRIQVWDSMQKEGLIISYEDLQFEDIESYPCKQNYNHYSRLSSKMIEVIENLVIRYENNTFK